LFKSAQVNGEPVNVKAKYWNYFLYFITKEQVKATVVPKTNPSMSSVLVWAFISKREEATNPFRRRTQ
jgi:hypothetical protein